MSQARVSTAKPDKAARRGARHARASLPAFSLYGEAVAPSRQLLHIESIVSRSRQYDWEIDAHVHQGLHQILWVREGSVAAMLDESRIDAQGPALLVIPPGVAHAFRFSPGCEGYVLTVDAGLLAEGDAAAGEALAALFQAPRSLVLADHAGEAARLHALFETLQAETRADDLGEHAGAGPVPRWLARALLWRLAQRVRREDAQQAQPQRRAGAGTGSSSSSLYTRWVVLMEAHYREHWPVTRYAERLGLSAERLNRLVRAETGMNAQALLHARLAREASRRLVHVAAPVSRLAFELGFEDPAYFCRFFKRQTGLSPRAYRERAAQARAEQQPMPLSPAASPAPR